MIKLVILNFDIMNSANEFSVCLTKTFLLEFILKVGPAQ